MSKGSKRRKKFVSNEEYTLRYAYAFDEISKDEFLKQLKEIRDVSSNSNRNQDHDA